MKRIEQAGYPFVPGSHGINLERNAVGSSRIETASGDTVRYSVTPDSIEIKQQTTLGAHMIAVVLPNSEIAFILKTVRDNVRHPDMYAGRFVSFALRNFELSGTDIQRMSGHWSPGSVNYSQFISTYELTGDLETAARSTWTGKTAEKNGFGAVDKNSVVWHPGKEVVVLFDRTQA